MVQRREDFGFTVKASEAIGIFRERLGPQTKGAGHADHGGAYHVRRVGRPQEDDQRGPAASGHPGAPHLGGPAGAGGGAPFQTEAGTDAPPRAIRCGDSARRDASRPRACPRHRYGRPGPDHHVGPLVTRECCRRVPAVPRGPIQPARRRQARAASSDPRLAERLRPSRSRPRPLC